MASRFFGNSKARMGAITATAVVALMAPMTAAEASLYPLSGATSSTNCDSFYTSANVRYTTVAGKTVRVTLSSVGKLGVKMRTKNENTGLVSATRYYPPLNTWQNMGYFSSKNSPFRFQFTCINPKNWWESSPSTDFSGTTDY